MSDQNDSLSERELEILRLVATGAANKEIARQLVISPNTVKVHLRNIFGKIGVASRTEATLYAMQIGLVTPGGARPSAETNGEENQSGQTPETENLAPGAAYAANEVAPGAAAPAQQDSHLLRRKSVQIAVLAALIVLALVGSGIAGARLIAPSLITPSAAVQIVQAATASTEIERWSTKPALPDPRKGMGIAAYNNAFYLIGGETPAGPDGAVLRFDPKEDHWETMASKPIPVTDVQAALLGEKIYVPGGQQANGVPVSTLEVYDPRENTWEQKSSLPVPISAYALATFEGRLYLFGGKSGDSYLASVFIYQPEEDRWTEGSPMESPRAYAGAAVVGGRIHIIGGYDGQHALTTNRAYIPSRDGNGETPWESYAPLTQGRYAMGTTNLANAVYLTGGLGEDSQPADPQTLQFLVQANQWSSFEAPPHKVGELPALIASGEFLYALGGETGSGLTASNQSYQAIYTISVPILQSNDSE